MKTKKLLTILFVFVMFSGISFAQIEVPDNHEPMIAGDVFWRLSPEAEKEALEKLNEDLKTNLKTIKEYDKERYFSLLRELSFSKMSLPFMRVEERTIGDTRAKRLEKEVYSQALALKYKNAKSSEKEALKKELTKAVAELFNQKEKERAAEVQMLEQQLQELKTQLEMRQKNRDLIIKRRVEELIGVPDYLEWD